MNVGFENSEREWKGHFEKSKMLRVFVVEIELIGPSLPFPPFAFPVLSPLFPIPYISAVQIFEIS